MTLLATDRYRLAVRELTLEPYGSIDASHVVLIPGSSPLADTAQARWGRAGSIERRPGHRRRW